MDEVKKVKNFVFPLYFCGKREVFTFTVSPRSFRSTLLCAADCSSSFFFPFRLEAGSYHLLTQFMNMGEDFTFPLSRRLLEAIDIVAQ